MHNVKVQFRSTDAETRVYNVMLERQTDNVWNRVSTSEVRSDASEAESVYLIEDNERLIIEAKNTEQKIVFDREQNANVSVEVPFKRQIEPTHILQEMRGTKRRRDEVASRKFIQNLSEISQRKVPPTE